MQFEGIYSDQDIAQIYKIANGRSLSSYKIIAWIFLLIGIGIGLVGAINYFLTGSDSPPLFQNMVIPLVLGGVFFWFSNQHRKRLEILKEGRMGTVDENGIRIRSDVAETNFVWKAFSHVRAKPGHVVLFLNPYTCYGFPKTFFANDDDWKKFLDIVNRKVKREKRKWRLSPMVRNIIIWLILVLSIILFTILTSP